MFKCLSVIQNRSIFMGEGAINSEKIPRLFIWITLRISIYIVSVKSRNTLADKIISEGICMTKIKLNFKTYSPRTRSHAARMTVRATGMATPRPLPPFSTTTTKASGVSSLREKPTNQAWSSLSPPTSAVPVLAHSSISGKLPSP